MEKGNAKALLPIGVFLIIYLGLGILFEYVLLIPMGFYNIPIVVAFLVALLTACLQNKAKSFEEKLAQRALMQFNYPKNYDIVYRALMKAGREDLIGYGKNCLIPPHKNAKKPASYGKPSSHSAARKTVNHQKKTESPSKGRSSHPARRNSK